MARLQKKGSGGNFGRRNWTDRWIVLTDFDIGAAPLCPHCALGPLARAPLAVPAPPWPLPAPVPLPVAIVLALALPLGLGP